MHKAWLAFIYAGYNIVLGIKYGLKALCLCILIVLKSLYIALTNIIFK